ncbi:MAG: response regulator, partial [Candidatus Aminicenantes bacterium]|nr:response regulator [Candidatus Aminicenantes bacterium]
MSSAEEYEARLAALQERLSRFTQASLRINESVDFHTVLQGVLDSACALTGARYGVLTPFDETGDIQAEGTLAFGVTPAQMEAVWDTLTGSEYCEFFEQLPGPTRHGDLAGLLDSLGLPGFQLPLPVNPPVAFLGVVLSYGGESLGAIYLAEKQSGPEFSAEDEEALVMFASQASMVMANARRYRDERKARIDLETLIKTSPVAVSVFDGTTGDLVSFNQEMARLFEALRTPGSPVEQLLEVLIYQREGRPRESLAEIPFTEALARGETVRDEKIELAVPDGRRVTALLNATPIHSDEGAVQSVVITLQDLAPFEEMERLRAEFLAMVSHELRTPLAAIKGSATTLAEAMPDLDPAEMRQFFRIITDQTDHMRELIADLLDVARIETGRLPVDPEPSEVRALVDEARTRFQNSGGRNDLQIEVPLELPRIMADRRRVMQVFSNLLTNAARNSHQSSPIKIEARREGVHVVLSVSDQGLGIESDRLPELFRKFSRIEGQDREGDTGLGLAICKGIVEAHGGRIWAESDGPGLGSRFSFTIPASDAGPSEPSRLAGRVPHSERRRPRILCVDDDPQMVRDVRNTLPEAGYAPIVTADPADVFELIENEEPRLILLDLVLPGIDGIELMRDIRHLVDVPVIFLSVYGEDDVIARAFDHGADDYLVKPFSPTELAARIRATLRRRNAPDGLEPTEPFVLGDLSIDYGERRVWLA